MMVVIMVSDEGSVVVFAVVLRGERRGASPPKMSSGLSQAHATRVCAQLNKELVGATHRPTPGPLFNHGDIIINWRDHSYGSSCSTYGQNSDSVLRELVGTFHSDVSKLLEYIINTQTW